MKPPNPSRPSMRSVVIGILLVARGRADGLRLFGDTSQSVLSGLAPLGAFLLVGVVAALVGHDRETLTDLLSVSIGFLGPLVLSFEVARRWNRAAQWRRFATAFCWCQWAAPLALAVVLILMAIMMTVGIQPEIAAGGRRGADVRLCRVAELVSGPARVGADAVTGGGLGRDREFPHDYADLGAAGGQSDGERGARAIMHRE